MRRILVDSTTLCAVEEVNRTGRNAVLFVHGWPLSKEIFESQYNVLPNYGIKCVSYDIRGFGESDRPWTSYTYDCLSDDLCAIIRRIDCDCVTLCGFSIGGAICARYMARHNGYKVNKLILMGAACPSFVVRPGVPVGMTREQVDILIAQVYNDRPRTCDEFSRRCFYNPPSNSYLRWFGDLCFNAAGYSTIKCLESLRDEDLRSDLGRIRVPTAIFHGLHDAVCPYPLAEEMHKAIRNSFVVTFENSGHCLFYEEKDKCNSSMIDFINS